MKEKLFRTSAWGNLVLIALMGAAWQIQAQDAKAEDKAYASIAPIHQYLMTDRSAEIALARSAAPESVGRDAEVLVLGRYGYETAVKGKNGFVCLVERSWMAPFDDPEFLNPDQRLPLCLNPPAAQTHLPLTFKATELAFAGMSKTQMFDSIKAAFDKKELPLPAPGSMCYMMSKQQFFSRKSRECRSPSDVLVSPRRPHRWGGQIPLTPRWTCINIRRSRSPNFLFRCPSGRTEQSQPRRRASDQSQCGAARYLLCPSITCAGKGWDG